MLGLASAGLHYCREDLLVDVLAAWTTGSSGHLLHEPWMQTGFRDGLAALITELEAAARGQSSLRGPAPAEPSSLSTADSSTRRTWSLA
jgi:hypothetical protein